VVVAHQRSLFAGGDPAVAPSPVYERVPLDAGSWVDLARGWLSGADMLLDHLAGSVEWHQGRRRMYDRTVDDPRLSCWFRDRDEIPHPAMSEIRATLETRYQVRLGAVGLNYYRDGRDSVAFHRDRELRESEAGMVAIVTLGATRAFLFRPRSGGRSIDVRPGSGDLIVMRGRCHRDWEHGVPKATGAGPRISVSTRSPAKDWVPPRRWTVSP
jgi:alkylated DNA repair dioxygenase AlkB